MGRRVGVTKSLEDGQGDWDWPWSWTPHWPKSPGLANPQSSLTSYCACSSSTGTWLPETCWSERTWPPRLLTSVFLGGRRFM